jgi:hypothetical protein
MANSDVWKDISSYIKVFTSVNFDEVPDSPGIYAWFYPINPPTDDIGDLEVELTSILNYDSKLEGEKKNKGKVQFNWKDLEVEVSEKSKKEFPSLAKDEWDKLTKDPDAFRNLQKIMLVASILMPPLYIGKTNDLRVRCRQHRNSSKQEENNFHNRFENFTKNKKLNNGKGFLTTKVEDLIFVCIKTDTIGNLGDDESSTEVLLEEIFKLIATPPYGKH